MRWTMPSSISVGTYSNTMKSAASIRKSVATPSQVRIALFIGAESCCWIASSGLVLTYHMFEQQVTGGDEQHVERDHDFQPVGHRREWRAGERRAARFDAGDQGGHEHRHGENRQQHITGARASGDCGEQR